MLFHQVISFSKEEHGISKKKKNPSLVKKILNEKVPLQRFGKPEEVANLVTYICSEKASFINGAVIRIDGGQTVKI